MPKRILTPKQSLLKGYMTLPVSKEAVSVFKEEMRTLADRIKTEESEEYNKNLIMQFLNRAYYAKQGCMVNTYGKTDMAIYNDGEDGRRPVVLFEFKGPGRPDMISTDCFRKKALYELVLYYLREEIKNANHDIKHLVITDCQQFFIFEKSLFYSLFAKNKKLVKAVLEADDNRNDRTEYIYNELIAPEVALVEDRMTCTYLNLQEFKHDIKQGVKGISPKLIAAYKILSPVHLMRLTFSSDHNTLNAKFYQELLYIMGLQEITVNKKKVISRLDDPDRQHYSLLEQAYSKLSDYDDITDPQQRFDNAIGLTLLWVNRVLFLKLLESQLVAFNASSDYKFLNIEKIPDYDVLNDLFREVLAKPESEREERARAYFANVPYLNSSLFEVSALEQHYFSISGLRAGKVDLFAKTILTDANGHRLTGQINELEYLFRFLDAFDFGETGRTNAMVAEKSKTIIDASVLGLIFEKINGYKDGSFFTPGYITQHICDTVIRQAVVEQFNRKKGWHCRDVEEIADLLGPLNRETRTEANDIVNSIRICDPAVGSGHFVVSALNTMIALKSEMGILQDHSEKPKPVNAWNITIEDDELVMKDEDGELFAYNPKDKESQRVQMTMFEEKKTIIENCLFGVDLNPKSVEICQLRLWIELLKSAYYVTTGEGRALRTLPNIDINIRCGDSLASRRPVCVGRKVESGQGLTKVIADYKTQVKDYINCHSKQLKKDIRAKIVVIKRKLNPPVELDLFGRELNEKQQREAMVLKRSLEWMIEFPEVLDEEGRFLGFDVIIGNPPYINTQELKAETAAYSKMRRQDEKGNKVLTYSTAVARADVYALFVERALHLLREDGFLSFIIPNKWEKVMYGQPLRRLFLQEDLQSIVDFGDNQVFSDATTYTCIINMRKRAPKGALTVSNIKEIHDDDLAADIEQSAEVYDRELFDNGIWHTQSLKSCKMLAAIHGNSDKYTTLSEAVGKESYRGLLTGLSKAFLISQSTYDELVGEDVSSREVIRPFISGSGLVAYTTPRISHYIIFTPKGFTRRSMQCKEDEKPSDEEAWQWFASRYPAVARWLKPFEVKAKARTDKGDYWWELRACDYYEKFAEPKIMYQAFQTKPCFIYQPNAIFCNNSMFFLSVKDRRLLALLNSKVGWWLISEFCPRIRNGYQLIWENLSQIPVPRNLPRQLDAIAAKMEEAIASKDARQEDLRGRIDEMVNELYRED